MSGFEFLQVKSWDGYSYVEMLSVHWQKQEFIRAFPNLDRTKIIERVDEGCGCGAKEYIEREYFNKLENIYNGNPR